MENFSMRAGEALPPLAAITALHVLSGRIQTDEAVPSRRFINVSARGPVGPGRPLIVGYSKSPGIPGARVIAPNLLRTCPRHLHRKGQVTVQIEQSGKGQAD